MEQVTQVTVESKNHVGFSYVVEIGRTMSKINGKWIQVFPIYIHTMPEIVSPDTLLEVKQSAIQKAFEIKWDDIEEGLKNV